MKKYLLLLIAAAVVLFLSTGPAMAQEPDPLTVMEAYDLALQAKDVEGALSLFADDAILTTGADKLVGKVEIRSWLERLVTQNERIEIGGREIAGAKVTWQNKFFRADLPTLSSDPLEAQAEATIEAGKIKTFSSILTDDSQAKLDAALAEQPVAAPAAETTDALASEAAAPAQETAATPAQLPSTGGAYAPVLPLSIALAVMGGLLLATGLFMRRLRRIG